MLIDMSSATSRSAIIDGFNFALLCFLLVAGSNNWHAQNPKAISLDLH
jgi:hypothetical protein